MYKNNPNVANAPAPTLPETTKPPMQNWSEHFHP
jgi:hypothetical protein